MTWNELLITILDMSPKQRKEEMKLFDYETEKFYSPEVCTDGEPLVHLTIN